MLYARLSRPSGLPASSSVKTVKALSRHGLLPDALKVVDAELGGDVLERGAALSVVARCMFERGEVGDAKALLERLKDTAAESREVEGPEEGGEEEVRACRALTRRRGEGARAAANTAANIAAHLFARPRRRG